MKSNNTLALSIIYLSLLLAFGQINAATINNDGKNLNQSAPSGTVEEETEDDYDDDFDLLEEDDLLSEVYDPIEPINRSIFWLNDKFYFYLLKPAASAYRIVPTPARISVSNFFSNLATPIRVASTLLQGKIRGTGIELARFCINTTIGIGGLFDPAKKYANLTLADEDLGQVLGSYGVGEGFYLVIPFIGPSNVRDAVGSIGDYMLSPTTVIVTGTKDQLIISSVKTVNAVSLDPNTYEAIVEDSLDPYSFIRDAYHQRRNHKINR